METRTHDLWALLARQVNWYLRGLADNHLRFLWVDDIAPDADQVTPQADSITGMAFVSEDSGRLFQHYAVFMVGISRAANELRSCENVFAVGFDPPPQITVDRAGKAISIAFHGHGIGR